MTRPGTKPPSRDAAGPDAVQRGGVVQLRRAKWIPLGVIVLGVVLDLVTPTGVTSAPLLMAAPVAAAPLLTLRGIIATGALAMAVHAGLAWYDGTFGWQRGVANQLTLLAVTALAVFINRALEGGTPGPAARAISPPWPRAPSCPGPPHASASSGSPPGTCPPRTRR